MLSHDHVLQFFGDGHQFIPTLNVSHPSVDG